jgi:hypothetical protein
MWQPEKKLVEVTARKRDELLAQLSARDLDPENPQTRDKVLELFQAFGMRSVMGLSDIVPSDQKKAAQDLAPLALAFLDPERLHQAAENLVLRAPELLVLEDEALKGLEDELEQNLRERDRVELVLSGCRAVLDHDPKLPLELETAILSFEDLVKDELWRLLPLGRRRAASIFWAEPSMRERFWWWALGHDIPETALEDLASAARIIHLFPKAKIELEAMVTSEKSFNAKTPKITSLKNISLRDQILKDRYEALCQKKADESVLKLAADSGQEQILLQEPKTSPKITISSDGQKLILDIEPPHKLKPGKKPILVSEGQKPLELVSTERGRFEAELGEAAFLASSGLLLVPLDPDDLVLEMPFKT